MSENWDFYPCRVEDEPASIMVNLGLAAEAPLEQLPDCTWLRVALQDPRADGLSSSDEFDRLCEIGDALDTAVREASTPLRYVGRCTSEGRRDFYTYAGSGLIAESVLSSMMAAFPEYEFDTGFRPDPHWRLYREFLYPTNLSLQLIHNRRVLEVLESKGDTGEVLRPVRHFAWFEQAEQAAGFCADLTEQRFEVVSCETDDRQQRQTVVFERDDPAEFVAINNLTLSLLELAESHGGQYDGWETQVCRPPMDTKSNE